MLLSMIYHNFQGVGKAQVYLIKCQIQEGGFYSWDKEWGMYTCNCKQTQH